MNTPADKNGFVSPSVIPAKAGIHGSPIKAFGDDKFESQNKQYFIPSQEYGDLSFRIHERAVQTPRVIKAQMELTYRCNLHCLHCYTDPYNAKEYFPREMTFEEICRILDEMAEMGILWLNFTGGEAMARKDFFEIYEYAYAKGFILSIYSNGTIFTEKIIERLKKNPPFAIDISCHSVTEEAFDRFTQVRGSFKRFLKGIKLLQASGLSFMLKTKAMSWNKDEIPTIREFYKSLGLAFDFTTQISPRLNRDRSSLDYRLRPEEIRALEAQEKVWTEDAEDCRANRAFLGKPDSHLYRCGCLAKNNIHVNAWAELGSCTLEYQVRVSLRKYSLRQAVEKLFTGIERLHYQSASPCTSCEIFSFCDKSPTAVQWETGEREKAHAWYCDTAFDRAERLTGKKMHHPLTEVST